MGYSTDFEGKIEIVPPLSLAEHQFLTAFSDSRRMDYVGGPYVTDENADVRNYNRPPLGQPGLWCNFAPTDDGTAIVWNGQEKTYDAPEWIKYITIHFLGSAPLAKAEFPFLQGHTLNGILYAQGEERDDVWEIHVENNVVRVVK